MAGPLVLTGCASTAGAASTAAAATAAIGLSITLDGEEPGRKPTVTLVVAGKLDASGDSYAPRHHHDLTRCGQGLDPTVNIAPGDSGLE